MVDYCTLVTSHHRCENLPRGSKKTVDDLLSSKHIKTRTCFNGVFMVFLWCFNRVLMVFDGRFVVSDGVWWCFKPDFWEIIWWSPKNSGAPVADVSQVMTDHFFPERDLWDERWRDEELRRQVIGVMKHGWKMLELNHGKRWKHVGKSPK